MEQLDTMELNQSNQAWQFLYLDRQPDLERSKNAKDQ